MDFTQFLVDHGALNGDVQHNGLVNALQSEIGGGKLTLIDGGSTGITGLNGFSTNGCHYWYVSFGAQKIVFLKINVAPTDPNKAPEYFSIQAAQMPDIIKPVGSVGNSGTDLSNSDDSPWGQTIRGLKVTLNGDGELMVGTSGPSKVVGQTGYHTTLVYIANN